MLLSELKKVLELEKRIGQLHSELAILYEERSRYINEPIRVAAYNTPSGVVQGSTEPQISHQASSFKELYKKLVTKFHKAPSTSSAPAHSKLRRAEAEELLSRLRQRS